MISRRELLLRASATGAAVLAPGALAHTQRAADSVVGRSVDDLATDEGYWGEIQQAFTLDRTFINLNNGYCSPSPRVVHEAFKRYLDLSNQAPFTYMVQ